MDSSAAGAPLKFDSGTWLERPPAAIFGEVGLYYVVPTSPTNPSTFWGTVVENNVLVWEFLGGSGGTALTPGMKYFVNNSATGNPQPLCLYATIAAAKAAFLADGHNAANPAVIWLCPSTTYTEDVTMVAGMSIKGLCDDYHFNSSITPGVETLPTITGIVDLGSDPGSLSYVRVIGHVINSGSAGPVTQVLDNVEIIANGAVVALDVINVNSHLFMHRVSVIGTETPGVRAMRCAVASLIDAVDIDVRAAAASQTALELTGAGTFNFRNSKFVGLISADAVSSALFEACDIASSGSSPFTLANAAQVTLRKSKVDSNFSVMVAGTGGFTVTDNDFPTVAGTMATTVTTSPVVSAVRPINEVVRPPGGAITTLDEAFTVTADGGNTTLTLLASNRVPLGHEFSIKKISNANALVVTRTGGDTVDGQVSVTLAANTQGAVRLRAIAGGYRIVAAYGSVTCP